MPQGLKQDIRVFFRNYKTASDSGRDALFQIADVLAVSGACDIARQTLPSCRYVAGDYLITHMKNIQQLPQILRIYVGAAEQLLGTADDFQLVKIHIRSGKVTFLRYDSFDTSPLPIL